MGLGFFSEDTYTRRKPALKKSSMCGMCKLFKTCNTPKMKPVGKGRKGILIIGECVSLKEDKSGGFVMGSPGALLKKTLTKNGIDLRKDCWKYNAVNCFPGKQGVQDKHIECCRPKVEKTIKRLKPKLIILMGTAAVQSLLKGEIDGSTGIDRFRGYVVPDFDHNCLVGFSFHPSYIRREEEKNPVARLFFEKDIERILSHLNDTVPQDPKYEERVICYTDFSRTEKLLKRIIKRPPKLLAFDYETTGLKPHAKGHKIVTCSVCWTKKKAYAFRVTNRVLPYLGEVFSHHKIGKIAVNMKYEDNWTRFFTKKKVEPLTWDPMIAAHCLDNRRGFSGLKLQTYLNFGIKDYNASVEKLLKGTEDHGNAFNRIHEIDIHDLLLYNGLDSLFTYMLALIQMEAMGIENPKTYNPNFF